MNRFTRAAVAAAVVCALYGAAQAQTILRWGDVVGGSHPQVQMIDRVAAEVKAKTGGRVEIQAFAGGQIGGSRDMIEAVANGSQQLVTEGAANFGAWIPSISVVEAPYIWRDPQHLIKALNGPLLAQYNEQLVKARGMRILGAVYYGTRHVTTSTKAVNTLADMKGLKLRVPENDVFKAMAESWGARPTPMNFNELYLALSQGAVDGQENLLPTIHSAKLQEVQKHLILTGHIITPRLVIVNSDFWKGLKDADRSVVEAAITEGVAWQDAELASQESSLVATLKAAGMTVTEPDLESFSKPVLASLPKQFESKWGKGTWDALAAL